ncbi:uncharacterized protein LOC128138291 [Harpia harpyja]|uniref:uncharacterized protein LOC128138291 n=1 Tax=Harpia harpyja TaxID=202280 RepID=UPI0022B1D6AE|nr:uncharacterized protein LOC128138291 [Harpia harpyja]
MEMGAASRCARSPTSRAYAPPERMHHSALSCAWGSPAFACRLWPFQRAIGSRRVRGPWEQHGVALGAGLGGSGPFPRAEVRWGSPGSPGAAPPRGGAGEVLSSPRYRAKGRETGWSELLGRRALPAESSPVFSPLAGCDKQVYFLPPLFPVSPSVSHEENPAWLILLAAQVDVSCHHFTAVALSSAMKVQDTWKDSIVVCEYKLYSPNKQDVQQQQRKGCSCCGGSVSVDSDCVRPRPAASQGYLPAAVP